jgi:magnesium chelatase family protein
VRERVIATRRRQYERQQKTNAELSPKELEGITETHQAWLSQAMEKIGLSARALHRCLRIARTIADLENEEEVLRKHLQEAIGFRPQLHEMT